MFKHQNLSRFLLNVLISCFHYPHFCFVVKIHQLLCLQLNVSSFTISITCSILLSFVLTFYWFVFKDFSHSYSSKLLIWFSSFPGPFLTKAYNCRYFLSIFLVSLFGSCFDSLPFSGDYFLDYLFSSPFDQTLFQTSSILFWIALYFFYFLQGGRIQCLKWGLITGQWPNKYFAWSIQRFCGQSFKFWISRNKLTNLGLIRVCIF